MDADTFMSWVWVCICVILVLLVLVVFAAGITAGLHEKEREKYIKDPFAWLTLMSTERWDTVGDLAQMMNAAISYNLYKVYTYPKKKGKIRHSRYVRGFEAYKIIKDLEFLEDGGYVEERMMFYNKEGEEVSDIDPSNINSSQTGPYHGRKEYKKTAKGKGTKIEASIEGKTTTLPVGGLVTET